MSGPCRSRRSPGPGSPGFTLFEVLGVIVVMAILLTVAANFYINLTRQAARASENTREVRRASALLDRIAVDLEHALLVRKPSEADPLGHPWLFLADERYAQGGADRLKFVRRTIPRFSDGPASDLAVVAYTLRRSEDTETFELRRWSWPELPDGLERDFPPDDDPGWLLVSDDLTHFAMRFQDENGDWAQQWDSSQLLDSGELPVAVEIEIGLLNPLAVDEPDELALDEDLGRYARQVQIPMRPLDLQALLDPGGEGEEGLDGEGSDADLADLTLADCIDFAQGGADPTGLSTTDLSTLQALAQLAGETLFAPYADTLSGHPAVRPECR